MTAQTILNAISVVIFIVGIVWLAIAAWKNPVGTLIKSIVVPLIMVIGSLMMLFTLWFVGQMSSPVVDQANRTLNQVIEPVLTTIPDAQINEDVWSGSKTYCEYHGFQKEGTISHWYRKFDHDGTYLSAFLQINPGTKKLLDNESEGVQVLYLPGPVAPSEANRVNWCHEDWYVIP